MKLKVWDMLKKSEEEREELLSIYWQQRFNKLASIVRNTAELVWLETELNELNYLIKI